MSKRFGSGTMIAGAMAAAIGFYTLSLHVSAERSKVDRLRGQIASDLKDIRALEAELRTRARLPVLQKWNDDVLAMSAPTAKQFVDSPVQLAAFAPNAPAAAVAGAPTVQLAIGTREEAAVQKPMLVKAAYEVPVAQLAALDMHAAEVNPTARPRIGEEAAPAKPTAKPEIKVEAKKTETKKAEPKKTKVETAKVEAKPALAGLASLAGSIDSAAAAERGASRKAAMR